jgi:hypothetical protein
VFPDPITEGDEVKNEEPQRNARRYAIGFTILYLILFPFFFYMGLLSSMIVFATPSVTVPIGLLVVSLSVSISLSMLLSIYLMWSRYLREQYSRIYFASALPPLTFVGANTIIIIIQALLQYSVTHST